MVAFLSLSHFLSFPFRVCGGRGGGRLWELWGQNIPTQPAAVYLSHSPSRGQIPLQVIYDAHWSPRDLGACLGGQQWASLLDAGHWERSWWWLLCEPPLLEKCLCNFKQEWHFAEKCFLIATSSLFSFKLAQEVLPQRQLTCPEFPFLKSSQFCVSAAPWNPPHPHSQTLSVFSALSGVGNIAFCILAKRRDDLTQFSKNALPKFLLGWDQE